MKKRAAKNPFMSGRVSGRRVTVLSGCIEERLSSRPASARGFISIRLAMIAFLSVFWISAFGATEDELRKDIETLLIEEKLAGIAWSLVGEDGEVSLGAAGLRDNPSEKGFTVDTRFHVGSLTKTVLATGVLRLVTSGALALDAPVSRYLPGLTFVNPWAGESDVTLRHLLDHTSGLNDAFLWQMFSERAEPDSPLMAAFPEPGKQLRIRSRPGTRFSYSNMGYTLLGVVIESVVKRPYEAYLDEHVLAPLKMKNSTFSFTSQEGENADPTLAWGHVDDGSRYVASPIFLRPAGQFTSTADDLARFAQFLMSDGVIDGQQFIAKTLMHARGKPGGTLASEAGLVAGYALGLGRRDRHGVVGFCHGGNIVGFVARLCIFPNKNKAFSYSVNTDSETANYGRFDSLFIDVLGITSVAAPQTANTVSFGSEWQGRYIFSPNRFQSFAYLDTVFGAIKVSPDGDMLILSSLQQAPRQLTPVGERIYSANDRATASHVLLRGEAGEALISDGFTTFERVSSAYLVLHWTSIGLGLGGMVWLLLAGLISVIRYRSGMWRRPESPAFIAIILLLLPIPFFMNQSFMALGDFTLASALLALVSLLLPVGMLLTAIRASRAWRQAALNRLHLFAAVFVIQWCGVLASNGMLPLMLWA